MSTNLLFIVWKLSPSVIVNSNFLNYIQDYKRLVTLEKPDTNPHYHVVLETTKTVGAMRNALNRLEPERKRKLSCEVSRKSLFDQAVYILKEYRLVFNNLLPDEVYDAALLETTRINMEKLKRMTPRQSLIEHYVPIDYIGDIGNTEVDYLIKAHISEYVCRGYPCKNPFSMRHMQDLAWAIWVKFYMQTNPYNKNNFLF